MDKLKLNTVHTVDFENWNIFIEEVYGRPYDIQQQEGCYSSGHLITNPNTSSDSLMYDSIPEVINSSIMGVKLDVWLSRNPKQKPDNWSDWELELWWHRNFYPDRDALANDLCNKGLLDRVEFDIIIDY